MDNPQYDMTPALRRAIEEWQITPAYLGQVPAFDRVLVFMIPSQDAEWKNGSLVYKGTNTQVIDSVKDKMERTAPRGVIVSAGLKALEQLRSNGIDVGHTVVYLRLSPYRPPVGYENRQLRHLNSIRAGDLMFSEDTGRLLREGKIRRVFKEFTSKDRLQWAGYVYEACPGHENDPDANFILSIPPAEMPSWEDM